jgi:hypothetical protein
LADPEKVARPGAWIDEKLEGEPVEAICGSTARNCIGRRRAVDYHHRQEARMSKKSDPTKADQLYLQLAKSTDAMRAAAKTYLRLAERTKELREREILLECAAFFAQLADRAGDQMQGSTRLYKKNGSF